MSYDPLDARFIDLKKSMSFTPKGQLITYDGCVVRNKQEVIISWGPADNSGAIKAWKKIRKNGQLPPSVKMVFLVDYVGLDCVEISAVGGPGFQNVTHETFLDAGNPSDIALEVRRTFPMQRGEKIKRLDQHRILSRKLAQAAMAEKLGDLKLIEIARTYAENYPKGTEAIKQKFGFSSTTAERRKNLAIGLGYLPPFKGSTQKDYDKALVRLQKKGGPAPTRSTADVKELLKKMKDGALKD